MKLGRNVVVTAILFALLAVPVSSQQATALDTRTMPPAVWHSEFVRVQGKKKLQPVTRAQEKCLADNIFYEAANQPYQGKLAVAFVTMNRLVSEDYPSSVCGVVYEQRHPIYCQFSWVCEKPTHFNAKTWQESLHIARLVIDHFKYGSDLKDPTHGALFFHTPWVSPKWKTAFTQTAQIADHIFYRK